MKLHPTVLLVAGLVLVIAILGLRALTGDDDESATADVPEQELKRIGEPVRPVKPAAGPGKSLNRPIGDAPEPVGDDDATDDEDGTGEAPAPGPAAIGLGVAPREGSGPVPASMDEVRAQEDPWITEILDPIVLELETAMIAERPLTPERYRQVLSDNKETAKKVIEKARELAEEYDTETSKLLLDTYSNRLNAYRAIANRNREN